MQWLTRSVSYHHLQASSWTTSHKEWNQLPYNVRSIFGKLRYIQDKAEDAPLRYFTRNLQLDVFGPLALWKL